jgi:HK97 family phage major capsid protein
MGGPLIAHDVRTDISVLPRRRMTVRGLLAPGQTIGNLVYFPRQVARQNNAAVVAEGAAKPKSDFTTEQVQAPVRTIAHYMDVTRQAFDDAPALRSLIDGELTYGLALAEETELLTGDGSGEHILGLIPQATAYSGAFAITGETAIDHLALALLQSELSLLPASGIVLNFTSWTQMKLLKDGMGRYILGDPADSTPPQLWGVPLVVTPAINAGTFLCGNFNIAAQIFDRMGVEILISSENTSNFTSNLYTIRCEERLAMGVKRATALITGTLP